MTIKPWKILSTSTTIHSPFRKILDVLFELPDGRQEVFALSLVPRVVTALALTPDRQVILARQFRPGPGVVLDELPGGVVDPGEELETAMRRELLEETGFAPGQLLHLGRLYEDGYSTIERHAYLALDCFQAGEQDLDANEFIEVVHKPLPEFVEQLRAGLSTDLEVAWAGLLAAGVVRFEF